MISKIFNFYRKKKQYFYLFLINISSIILAILAYNYFNNKIEILGSILATGISISFGLAQYNIENDKIFKDLFYEFNQKYDERFNNKLNEIEYTLSTDKSISISEEERELIIDYLNFCAEEYLWYTKGRIPENVWKSWKKGMLFFFKLAPIKPIILSQFSQKESYYGFFDEIEKDLGLL